MVHNMFTTEAQTIRIMPTTFILNSEPNIQKIAIAVCAISAVEIGVLYMMRYNPNFCA